MKFECEIPREYDENYCNNTFRGTCAPVNQSRQVSSHRRLNQDRHMYNLPLSDI